jgi:hypothetical protein
MSVTEIGVPEEVTGDTSVIDTDEFLGRRNGLSQIQDLYPDGSTSTFPRGFEHRDPGGGVTRFVQYRDDRDGVWKLRIEQTGELDMTIYGGVLKQQSKDATTLTIVRPSSTHSPLVITGVEIRGSKTGRVRISRFRDVLQPGASSDSQTEVLIKAANKANMQRMRTALGR